MRDILHEFVYTCTCGCDIFHYKIQLCLYNGKKIQKREKLEMQKRNGIRKMKFAFVRDKQLDPKDRIMEKRKL